MRLIDADALLKKKRFDMSKQRYIVRVQDIYNAPTIDLEEKMSEICGDNRFEIIEMAKEHLLDATNIDTSPKEMEVLDNFLFRCWQMGWLDRYEQTAQHTSKILDAYTRGWTDGADAVKAMPSAEPKRGEWIKARAEDPCYWICSECKRQVDDIENFCPNCGADMRQPERSE